eukprot:7027711-Lingulodinium_polyedra.AAC.1
MTASSRQWPSAKGARCCRASPWSRALASRRGSPASCTASDAGRARAWNSAPQTEHWLPAR